MVGHSGFEPLTPWSCPLFGTGHNVGFTDRMPKRFSLFDEASADSVNCLTDINIRR